MADKDHRTIIFSFENAFRFMLATSFLAGVIVGLVLLYLRSK